MSKKIGFPRLGVRLHGGMPPARCMELARAAEASGFASIWFAENPFERGILPAAAACAVLTSRLRIGIGVFNPFNRHPTLIAMEIGALDELAGGRAALGIGSGVGTAIEAIGFASDRPIAAVRDAFAIVRRLLGGEAVTYEGEIFSAKGVKLGYRPLRSAMPLFMAARGDQSLRLCGRIADGLMISNMCSPGFTRYAVGLVRDAARAAGRASPAEVVQYVPCAVAASRDEAYVGAKEALGRMLPGFWSLGQRLPAAKAALLRDSGIGEGEFAAAVRRLRAGEPAVRAVDDRFVTAFAVAGTVEDCLTQSARYAEAGVTELVLTFVGNVPTDDIAELGVRLRDGVA